MISGNLYDSGGGGSSRNFPVVFNNLRDSVGGGVVAQNFSFP